MLAVLLANASRAAASPPVFPGCVVRLETLEGRWQFESSEVSSLFACQDEPTRILEFGPRRLTTLGDVQEVAACDEPVDCRGFACRTRSGDFCLTHPFDGRVLYVTPLDEELDWAVVARVVPRLPRSAGVCACLGFRLPLNEEPACHEPGVVQLSSPAARVYCAQPYGSSVWRPARVDGIAGSLESQVCCTAGLIRHVDSIETTTRGGVCVLMTAAHEPRCDRLFDAAGLRLQPYHRRSWVWWRPLLLLVLVALCVVGLVAVAKYRQAGRG